MRITSKIKILLAILSFFFTSSASAACTPVNWNDLTLVNNIGKRVFRECEEGAEKGYMIEMYILGTLYLHGVGTRADENLAEEWFLKAYKHARGDYADAISSELADIYYNREDYKNAMEWDKKTAKGWERKDRGDAQNRIGYMYEKGQGVEVNYAEAKKWYELGAKSDNKYAKENLAGLNKSPLVAAWFKAEAKKAEQKRLDDIAEHKRQAVAAEKKRLADIANATKRNKKICYAENGKKEVRFNNCIVLARGGDTKSQTLVADMYFTGSGTKRNYDKSLHWYKKLAKAGDTSAKLQIPVVENKLSTAKAEAKEKQRIKLANTWFALMASDWYRKKGVQVDTANQKCEKSKSPADYAGSLSMVTSDLKFEDELEHNNEVTEVTVSFTRSIQGYMPAARRFFRGLERCEAYLAKEKKVLKDTIDAKNKALDKYR